MATKKKVGVRDVARLAGVSLGTVSNVLNNPAMVGEETLARVRKIMDECGFVPSRAAGQLRSRRSRMVGVIVPDVGNPYWAAVIRGAESVLEREGLTLIVGSTRQDSVRQQEVALAMTAQGVDGLIVAPIDEADLWSAIAERELGVVAVAGPESVDRHAGVLLDNEAGAALAIGHLLDLGHRDIAFINGPRHVPWCSDRWRGAVDGFVERGLDPSLLTEIEVSDLTATDGRSACARLLASEKRPSAVFCANDLVALGVLLELHERGMSVPGDVSLIGYDDVEFVSALRPPLTTVRQPSFELGVLAAEALLSRGERGAEAAPLLTTELVVRESTAPRQA